MNEIPFKTIDGIDIFLDPDGKFSAKIREGTMTRPTLIAIIKEIQRDRKTVKAYNLSQYTSGLICNPVDIKGYEKRRAKTSTGVLRGLYDPLFIISPEQLDQIRKIIKKHDAINEEWRRATQHLMQLTPENFDKYYAETLKEEAAVSAETVKEK
jgi:hypothetical protein